MFKAIETKFYFLWYNYFIQMNTERLKLLIVEDEPDICASLHSYFGKRDFIISMTGSGHEALSMIKASAPDLVLLDIALNDLSGIEMLKQLRAYDTKTRVVIITGQMYSDEDVKKIFELGISDYRSKPLVIREVEELVYQTVGRSQPYAIKPPEKIKKEACSQGDIVHALSNLLGVIRNRCENFTLNVEEGIYKDKSPEDLVKMSTDIMKDVQETVDKTMRVVEQIKE